MATFKVDRHQSRMRVTAKSSLHDTTTVWDQLTGSVDVDVPELSSAKANVNVEMSSFDAGSWLKNRHLKKEMGLGKPQTASFELLSLSVANQEAGGNVAAEGMGAIVWNGQRAQVSLEGEGTITEQHIAVTCRFILNVRDVGITPPGFLGMKVEDEVSVVVSLHANAESN